MASLAFPPKRDVAHKSKSSTASTGLLSENSAVIATNDDATSCKHSCVKLGYFADDFVQFFVSNDSQWNDRKAPLINRGYYSRVSAVRATADAFLQRHLASHERVQFITLGAGFDTLYFHTRASLSDDDRARVSFFELDFPSVVESKLVLIAKFAPLAQSVSSDWTRDVTRHSEFIGISAPQYHALGVDLADLAAVQRCLRAANVDATRPTLILSECVLIYIDAEHGNALLRWLAETFAHSAVLTYEQIRPDDAFGRMMLENLARRGCRLETLLRYPTLDAQRQRYLDAGWTNVRADTMLNIYRHALDAQDRQRIERLEIFDEMEEWRLFQTHYMLVVAQRGDVQLDFPPAPPGV